MLLISAPYYPPLNKHCLACPSAGIPSYRFEYAKPSSPSRKKQEAREVCVYSKPGDVFQGMADDEWRDGGSQTAGCRSQQTRNSLQMADRALVVCWWRNVTLTRTVERQSLWGARRWRTSFLEDVDDKLVSDSRSQTLPTKPRVAEHTAWSL